MSRYFLLQHQGLLTYLTRPNLIKVILLWKKKVPGQMIINSYISWGRLDVAAQETRAPNSIQLSEKVCTPLRTKWGRLRIHLAFRYGPLCYVNSKRNSSKSCLGNIFPHFFYNIKYKEYFGSFLTIFLLFVCWFCPIFWSVVLLQYTPTCPF